MDRYDLSRGRRGVRSSAPLGVLFAVLVGAAGAAGIIRAADSRIAAVARIDGLEGVLAVDGGPAVNYLLIGSDSREGVSGTDTDFGAVGDTGAVEGRRSDTIMILRQEEDSRRAALVSLPRDLWVTIAGRDAKNRINSAYNDGPAVLAATITQSLGIPIHHVVDVDFIGFKGLVDAAGGAVVCFDYPTRDGNSGLDQQPGCNRLDGVQALAYARSRYYEEFRDGEWQTDGTADLGRIERQQKFISTTVTATLDRLQSDPFIASDLVAAVAGAVRLDPGLDPFAAASTLREAFGGGFTTYQLDVSGTTIDGKSVLVLEPGSEPILNYFRGLGPLPPAGT